MKRIKSVSAVEFKGRSFKNILLPVTVFVGDNFTGKSSRTEAMTLALAGYLPNIEKKAGAIHERYASGQHMAAVVEFDDGTFVSREYSDHDGKVSCKVGTRGLSKDFAIDPVQIDANEFLGLSSKERVKFLFQRLSLDGEIETPVSLFAKLQKTGVANDENAAEQIVAMGDMMTEDHEGAVTAGLTPQAWMESLFLTLNDDRKMAIAEQKRLLAESTGSNQDRPEMLALNRTAIVERVTKATAAVKAALEALNEAKVAHRTATVASVLEEQKAVDKLQNQLDNARSREAQAESELDEVSELDCCPKCQAKSKGWRDKIEAAAKSALDDCTKTVLAFEKSLKKAHAALDKRQKEIAKENAKRSAALTKALDEAQSNYDAAVQEQQTAQGEHLQMTSQDAETARRNKQREALVKIGVRVEILKELCNIVQTALDDAVEKAIVPFLERVNELCGEILVSPVVYRDGELGMLHGEAFASWKSFSGTEKALFLCGVSIALASEAELKLVILDEVGRLDDANKEKVLTRLVKLIETEAISQAVLIDVGQLAKWMGWAKAENNGTPGTMAVVEVK